MQELASDSNVYDLLITPERRRNRKLSHFDGNAVSAELEFTRDICPVGGNAGLISSKAVSRPPGRRATGVTIELWENGDIVELLKR
jgi:hypothetical protein